MIALITPNCSKNPDFSILFFFFVSQYDIKKTYPSLKNSAGCIFGSPGISTHHLAVPLVAAIQGIKTHNWKRNTPIVIKITSFFSLKKDRGIHNAHIAISTAITKLLN